MNVIRKFVLLHALLLCTIAAQAQRPMLNMAEHDQKAYYFGITFGLNYSQYRIQYTDIFAQTDTFKIIQPKWGPGFNLGIMANLRLTNFVDARFIPSLLFAEKSLKFNRPLEDSVISRTVESILVHLPLQFKFKSDRIRNFRFYGMLGGKVDYDLAANARSRRQDEFLKVNSFDYGYELGFGFEFYNPNFIFSPELKLSQGLNNQIFKDPNLPLSNSINQINTRLIVISIHLEG